MTNEEKLQKVREDWKEQLKQSKVWSAFNGSDEPAIRYTDAIQYIEALLTQVREEERKRCIKLLKPFFNCDDECQKGYKCYYEHHDLMKDLKEVEQKILNPDQNGLLKTQQNSN